jgi:hypothetical protein
MAGRQAPASREEWQRNERTQSCLSRSVGAAGRRIGIAVAAPQLRLGGGRPALALGECRRPRLLWRHRHARPAGAPLLGNAALDRSDRPLRPRIGTRRAAAGADQLRGERPAAEPCHQLHPHSPRRWRQRRPDRAGSAARRDAVRLGAGRAPRRRRGGGRLPGRHSRRQRRGRRGLRRLRSKALSPASAAVRIAFSSAPSASRMRVVRPASPVSSWMASRSIC